MCAITLDVSLAWRASRTWMLVFQPWYSLRLWNIDRAFSLKLCKGIGGCVYVLPGMNDHSEVFLSEDSRPCLGTKLNVGRIMVTLALFVAHGMRGFSSESSWCWRSVGTDSCSSLFVPWIIAPVLCICMVYDSWVLSNGAERIEAFSNVLSATQ